MKLYAKKKGNEEQAGRVNQVIANLQNLGNLSLYLTSLTSPSYL